MSSDDNDTISQESSLSSSFTKSRSKSKTRLTKKSPKKKSSTLRNHLNTSANTNRRNPLFTSSSTSSSSLSSRINIDMAEGKGRRFRRSARKSNQLERRGVSLSRVENHFETVVSEGSDLRNSLETLEQAGLLENTGMQYLDEMDYMRKSVMFFDMERRMLEKRRLLMLQKVDEILNSTHEDWEDVRRWEAQVMDVLCEPIIGGRVKEAVTVQVDKGMHKEIFEFWEVSEMVEEALERDYLKVKKNIFNKRKSFTAMNMIDVQEKVLERRSSDSAIKNTKVTLSLPKPKRKLKTSLEGIIPISDDPFDLSKTDLDAFTAQLPASEGEIHDENGELEYISLRKLITTILIEYDEETVNDFLITVEYYADPCQLLQTIIVFYLSPKKDFEKGDAVCDNICKFLVQWIQIQYRSLRRHEKWNSLLERFIDYLSEDKKKKSSKKNSKRLKIALDDFVYKDFVHSHILNTQRNDEKELTVALMEISPELMAQQLTLREQQYFREISLSEFYFTRWSSPWAHYDRQAPNLKILIERFNNISFWVATTIIASPNIGAKERGSIITYWIHVTNELYLLCNFNTASQICSALNMTNVKGLSRSWHFISKADIELFDELNLVLSPIVAAYRKHIQTIKKDVPIIPRLDIMLRDLTLIEEDKDVNEHGLINISKMHLIARTLKPFIQNQEKLYKFSEDEEIQQLLFRRFMMDESRLDEVCRTIKSEKEKSMDYNIGIPIFEEDIKPAALERGRKGSVSMGSDFYGNLSKKGKRTLRKKRNRTKTKRSLEMDLIPATVDDIKENSTHYNYFLEYLKNSQADAYLLFYFDVKRLESETLDEDVKKVCDRLASKYLGFGIEDAIISYNPVLKPRLVKKVKTNPTPTMFNAIKEQVKDELENHYQYYKREVNDR